MGVDVLKKGALEKRRGFLKVFRPSTEEDAQKGLKVVDNFYRKKERGKEEEGKLWSGKLFRDAGICGTLKTGQAMWEDLWFPGGAEEEWFNEEEEWYGGEGFGC